MSGVSCVIFYAGKMLQTIEFPLLSIVFKILHGVQKKNIGKNMPPNLNRQNFLRDNLPLPPHSATNLLRLSIKPITIFLRN
jgi:hypothetical protein